LSRAAFRHDLLSVFGECFGLRQKFKRLGDLRIAFGANLQPFVLTEGVDENFALDRGTDPIIVLG